MCRNDTSRSEAEASKGVCDVRSAKRDRESESEDTRCARGAKRSAIKLLVSLVNAVLLVAGLAFPKAAWAVCTQHGSVTSSSGAIVGSNDISGIEGRHYLMIQNTGTSNAMEVAIGSSNNATSSDTYLGPGASWVMTMQGLKMVPGGDVAAISASGTTYGFCDW